MIRAAADGDAQALKGLLTEGVDVNGANPGGQTALILAAVMGRSDVVRLLLQAGADVRVRDNHGLTALDWAQRKGLAEITQLLISSSAPRRPPTPGTTASIQPLPESSTTPRRPSPEPERETTSGTNSHSSTEAPQQSKEGLGPAAIAMMKARARQADLQTEAARPEPAAEEKIPPKPLQEKVSSEPDWWWTQKLHEGRVDELTSTTEPETLRARLETERIFEQARLRIEEEVRRKAELQTRRPIGREQFPAPRTTVEATNIKRCPKCNTIYENDTRTYCAYDAGRLVSVDEFSPNIAVRTLGRPTLWVLVAITLFGSVLITYVVTNYLAREERADPPATAPTEPAVKPDPNAPVVGGALVGKEIELPNAEYPAAAKKAGISGTVTVVVRVNRQGLVVSARALNGERQLRAAAVKAATKATFSPERLAAEGQVVAGTISYSFKP